MLIDNIIKSPIFAELKFDEIETIASFSNYMVLDDNHLLISEDDDDDHAIYLLAKGSLEIVSSKDANISSEVVISHQEKDLFGEIAWITREKRTASVKTHGPSDVVRINGDKLDEFILSNPKAGCVILRNVSRSLCERIKGNNILIKQILWNY